MITNNIKNESYEAPALEVFSTTIEYGFSLSSVIEDAMEDEYGNF